MMDEFEGRRAIVEAITPVARSEGVSLGDSPGRILAADIAGLVDLPGFDNSSMDGYAVKAAEAKEGAELNVTGEQPAGEDRKLSLDTGEAIRIFTGAPMPEGADAVVMQEDVQVVEPGEKIRIVEGVEPGENVRRRGADVCAGQRLLTRGTGLTAPMVGLLASQGCREVPVRPRPRVGIVTTGDELVEAGETRAEDLAPGQLFNSNGPMLEAAVRSRGGIARRWHAPDEPGELKAILAEALSASDFLLVAGGVSVGERDFVKETLAELGVETAFWRVRVKPGKPFVFGRQERAGDDPVYVFGLPGNPVSAFVTFQIFAAPAMARWSGKEGFEDGTRLPMPSYRSRIAGPLSNPGDRPHYLRMMIDGATGELKPAGLQQSHALFGLSRADALLRMAPGQELAAGDSVSAWLL